jgi:hypothetical protein
MADIYRDGAVTPDGSVLSLQVSTAELKMHLRVSPFRDYLWRHAQTDRLWYNGVQHRDREVFGINPACFDYRDGSFLVQYADNLGTLTRFDRSGTAQVGTIPVEAASEGIHHVEPDGRIIMGNDPSLIRRVKPGEEAWAGCIETANYIIGAYGQGQLATFHKPTGVIKRWLGETFSPHWALETAAGEIWVFINGTPNSPEPNQVPWVETPVTPPVDPPPTGVSDVSIPLPVEAKPAAFVGCSDAPVSQGPRPGSAVWSLSDADAQTPRPVMEGIGYQNTIRPQDDLLLVFWGTEAASGGLPALDESMAWAKQRRCGLYLHCDDPRHRELLLVARERVLAEGLVPVLGAHCVSNVTDFENDARAFSSLGAWGITINFTVRNKDREAFKACLLRALKQWHDDANTPKVVWFARWGDAGPSMKAYCAEVCRLTPTPVTRPHERSEPQKPTQPPWPNTSDPPVVKRKSRFRVS